MTDTEYDVIVAGYGFAGAVAAIAAHDAKARVLILEKQPDPGGISVCSAGGLRVTSDANAALRYLRATNAGTVPEEVLAVLATGMAEMPAYVETLSAAVGATSKVRASPANYPLPGYKSFGFATVDACPDFEPARDLPHVRGSPAGARLFEVLRRNVAARGIEVRLGTPAERLVIRDRKVTGVLAGGRAIPARRGVVLACGGFEAAPDMQAQWWTLGSVLSAASRFNTGDGIRMGQFAGAGLWHLWHFHGSYGFRHPDPAYPFGIRLKRLPDWNPAEGLRQDVCMSWILVDRDGQRFMNEYDPYMQDTGHRPMAYFDPARQCFPRVPAYLIVDARGRELYPLSAPTWHDRTVADHFRHLTPRQLDALILAEAPTIEALAASAELDPAALRSTIDAWNEACDAGSDTAFNRPPGSMMPIASPPFAIAPVWPIVSNTQGGLAHDVHQRVLDAYGEPIPGLWVAGELGSVFGHLYMSGGNIAECFVGGRIAGREASGGPYLVAAA